MVRNVPKSTCVLYVKSSGTYRCLVEEEVHMFDVQGDLSKLMSLYSHNVYYGHRYERFSVVMMVRMYYHNNVCW